MSVQGGEIREGFLCPMCMKDLGTVSQLQSHFEEAHSTEDKATLHQLRGKVLFTECVCVQMHFKKYLKNLLGLLWPQVM